MLSRNVLPMLPPGLRCSPCPPARLAPSRQQGLSSALRCCSVPDDKSKRRSHAPIINNISGDLYLSIGEGAKTEPVGWDAVAISPEAKALLQHHAVKASTALKMHRILGFEDLHDVQHLTPDLIAKLKLQPLQLDPLLSMLQQLQPGTVGHHQAGNEHGATALKPLEHSGLSYRAISPDGRIALANSGFVFNADDKLEAWDLATGTRFAVMDGHRGRIVSVAITPNGRQAVSGSQDKTLRVWDLATHACIATLEGHSSSILSVAITPDGSHAVSGSTDKTVRVWDLATRSCLARLQGHAGAVNGVAITPDGLTVVSGSNDETLRLWDLATRRCILTLKGHTAKVQSVAITPDGRTAVSASKDKTLRLWDLATHACTATLEGHTDEVGCVAVTPDGRHAVSGSNDTTARLWDLATRTCIATMEGHEAAVFKVLITPDGRHAVSNTVQGNPKGNRYKARVWDLAAYLGTAGAAAGRQ